MAAVSGGAAVDAQVTDSITQANVMVLAVNPDDIDDADVVASSDVEPSMD